MKIFSFLPDPNGIADRQHGPELQDPEKFVAEQASLMRVVYAGA